MHLLRPAPGVCSTAAAAASTVLCLGRPSTQAISTRLIVSHMSTLASSIMLNNTQGSRAVAARQQLLRHAPIQLLRIRGVSFNQRKQAVQQLVPGQPLMFIKEPSHPLDPGAVQIATLDGTTLGYVNQRIKDAFQLPVCFGSVASVGPVSSGSPSEGLWGASVASSPAVWGMTLDLLPAHWAQQTDLQVLQQAKYFVGQQSSWQEYEGQVLAQYQQRCAVTGIPASEMPLQLIPRWQFDHHKQEVQINPRAPFIPWCQPLVQLQQMADKGLDAVSLADRQDALELLRWINCWTEQECDKYVQYVQQRRQQLELEGWKLQTASALS